MGDMSFRVVDLAVWPTPAGGKDSGGSENAGTKLPIVLRRRVTAIGREALEVAWSILPPHSNMRMILASRHSEYQRTLALFSALSEEGAVSPADFSMSVHHALVGLLSIVSGNRAGHTAVAAGPDSFGYGLLEAIACLTEDGGPVMLIYFDEPLPDFYAPALNGVDIAPIALAMILAAPSGDDHDTLAISMTAKAGEAPATPAQAREFLDFLAADRPELRMSGERHDWRWRRAA